MVQSDRAPAQRGSQKWIQKLVNENQVLLDSHIAKELELLESDSIEWLSPLKTEGYHEYSDQESLVKLRVELRKYPLADFWPQRGPKWDALGRTKSGKLLLVEAKSHIGELLSTCCAGNTSRQKIEESLKSTRRFLNSNSDADWTVGFYQVANRLAHLYLLRQNDLPAYLVFVYFLNDVEMSGPATKDRWQGALDLLHSYLGLGRHKLQKYIAEIFIDVREI